MIGYSEVLRRPADFSSFETKLVESEKCAALVHHVEIDIEQVLARGERRSHARSKPFRIRYVRSFQHPKLFEHGAVFTVIVLHPFHRVGITDRTWKYPEIQR